MEIKELWSGRQNFLLGKKRKEKTNIRVCEQQLQGFDCGEEKEKLVLAVVGSEVRFVSTSE